MFGSRLFGSPLQGPPGVLLPSILPSSARPARRGAFISATSAALGAQLTTEKQNLHAPIANARTPYSRAASPLLHCEQNTYQCRLAALSAAAEESESVAWHLALRYSSASVAASWRWLTAYWGRGWYGRVSSQKGADFLVGTGNTRSAPPPIP